MKTRLTSHSRARLVNLAKSVIACPTERAALDQAYAAAAPLVRAAVERKFPPSDMKVLQMYGKASVDDCVRVTGTGLGDREVFTFARGAGPLSIGCQTFLVDDETAAAVTLWKRAETVHASAMKRKESDYRLLINACRTFEDVTEVWPEAESVRAEIVVNAITVVNEDLFSRIRADVAARAAAV